MGQQVSIETVMHLAGKAMDARSRDKRSLVTHEAWADASALIERKRYPMRRVIRWDVSGRCRKPVPVELFSRYNRLCEKVVPMTVILTTKCRRCGWCLMQRRNLWAEKAIREVKQAPRTWFLTLTLAPEEHHRLLSSVRLRVSNYDSLPHDRRFAELLRTDDPALPSYGRELTLFLKRVRKNSGQSFRYLLVAEAHKSGLPHFHVLLHEKDAPIRKAVIKTAWTLGFSKVALCDSVQGAVYLCKYLAKESSTRVRASFQYGKQQFSSDASSMHSVAWSNVTPTKEFCAGLNDLEEDSRGELDTERHRSDDADFRASSTEL